MGSTGFDIVEVTGGLARKEWTSKQTKVIDGDGVLYADAVVDTFDVGIVCAAGAGYGNPTGTTGDVNRLLSWPNYYEYHVKGSQIIVAPTRGANGVDIGMDQHDNDGVELTNGITARSKAAYTVGTDNCYFEATCNIADVSGTDDFCVGFRKQAAYAANVDDYTDAAYFQVVSTAVNIETILNNAATSTTATTNTVADGVTFTLRVEVRSGVTWFYINDEAPSTQVNFTFDTGDVIMPFIFFLHSSDLAGAVNISRWECGKLYDR